jgi:uncharacterized membrane protein
MLVPVSGSPFPAGTATPDIESAELQVDLKTETIMMAFGEPELVVEDWRTMIRIGDLPRHMQPHHPDLVFESMSLKFPFNTRILEIDAVPGNIMEMDLGAPVAVNPPFMAIGYEGMYHPHEETFEKWDGSEFPTEWYRARYAHGIDDMGERCVWVSLWGFPIRTEKTHMRYTDSILFTISYKETPLPEPMSDETYNVIIIGSSSFDTQGKELEAHKRGMGTSAKWVTITDIQDSTYFPVQGSDTKEKIKYFIKNAIENWSTTDVVLFGDTSSIPPFYVNWLGENVPTDLYYGDIYGANGGMADWSDVKATSSSNFDLADDSYIDVYIGRLPVDTVSEASVVVDKVVHYENDTNKDYWFYNASLVGTNPFSGNGNEGEHGTDHIADIIDDDFPNITKLYVSTGTATPTHISNSLNQGAGIFTYAGHGLATSLAIGSGNPSYSVSHVNGLTNGYKMPIGSQAACLTGYYDRSTHSFSEAFVLKSGGGAIADMGSSRVAYGATGTGWPHAVAGAMASYLHESLVGGSLTAGSMYAAAHTKYMNNNMWGVTDFKTIIEFIWFAEPSMLIMLSMDMETENMGTLMPGEPTSFNVTLNNHGMSIPIELKYDNKSIPEDWSISFFPAIVEVEKGNSSTVKAKITPSSGVKAGTKIDLPLFAYVNNMKRSIASATASGTVGKIVGMEASTDYPATGVNIKPGGFAGGMIHVDNLGNDDESVEFEIQEPPEGWTVEIVSEVADLPFMGNASTSFMVTAPEQCLPRWVELNVTASMVGQDLSETFKIKIVVDPIRGWNASAPITNRSVALGESTNLTIEFDNFGNVPEFLTITKTMPPSWVVNITDTCTMDPYSSSVLEFDVWPPELEVAGAYDISIGVSDGKGNDKNFDFVIDVEPAPSYNYSVSPEFVAMNYDESGSFIVFLENTGNTPLDMSLLATTEEDWVVEPAGMDVTIDLQEQEFITMTVIPPEGALADNYSIFLKCVGVNGSIEIEENTEITATLLPYTEFEVSIDIDEHERVKPGETVTNLVKIVNKANAPLEVTDLKVEVPEDWKYTVEETEITIPAFSEAETKVLVTTSKDMRAGTYTYAIMVNCGGEDHVLKAKVPIKQIYAFEAALSTQHLTLMQGSQALVKVNITNNGNDIDDFKITLNAPSWFTLSKTGATIDMDRTSGVTVTVRPMETIEPGDYAASITILSKGGKIEEKLQFTVTVSKKPQEEIPGITAAGGSNFYLGLLVLVIALVVIGIVAGAAYSRRKKRRTLPPEPHGRESRWDEPVGVVRYQDTPPETSIGPPPENGSIEAVPMGAEPVVLPAEPLSAPAGPSGVPRSESPFDAPPDEDLAPAAEPAPEPPAPSETVKPPEEPVQPADSKPEAETPKAETKKDEIDLDSEIDNMMSLLDGLD